MIRVYDFTSQQASYMGALFQLFGIAGGLLCSLYINSRSSKGFLPPYKFFLLLIGILTTFSKSLALTLQQ
jgi:drug/metabolite transporter superfamily protein YnfA